MTKLERLRKEIPADLPDDWNCIVRAGDARALLDAADALKEIQKQNDSDCRYCDQSAWKHSKGCPMQALAALDALEEP